MCLFYFILVLLFNVVNGATPSQLFLTIFFRRQLFVERGVFDIMNVDNIYTYVSQFILCGDDLPSTSNNKFVKFQIACSYWPNVVVKVVNVFYKTIMFLALGRQSIYFFWIVIQEFLILGGQSLLMILCFHSLHGLVRGENMELGRDSDTGGQVKLTNCSPPSILGVFMLQCSLTSCLKVGFQLMSFMLNPIVITCGEHCFQCLL